jgi:hypothetical protein
MTQLKRFRFLGTFERLESRDNPADLWVTSTADAGANSLRAQLAAADNGDVIRFSLPSGQDTITLTSGELIVNKSVTINAGTANAIKVKRSATATPFRIMTIGTETTVTVDGLVISGGYLGGWTGAGGGVFVHESGELTTQSVIVSNNSISSSTPVSSPWDIPKALGGGIFALGKMGLNATNVTNNTLEALDFGFDGGGTPTNAQGAGVFVYGKLILRNSTVTENRIDWQPMTAGWQQQPPTFFTHALVQGGGIFVQSADATISYSNVSGNSLVLPSSNSSSLTEWSYGQGGGVYNARNLDVSGSNIQSNAVISALSLKTVMEGGGIYNALLGKLIVNRSLLHDNRVSGREQTGGGLYNLGTATFENTTVSGNRARNATTTSLSIGTGGGIAHVRDTGSTKSLSILFCTITDNQSLSVQTGANANPSASYGGGVLAANGGVTMNSSVVAGNKSFYLSPGPPFSELPCDWPDYYGTVNSTGRNLVGVAMTTSGWIGTDLTGTQMSPRDAKLAPLRNNGLLPVGPPWQQSPTLTHQPYKGSPVVEAGDPATSPPWDQRQAPRNMAKPFIGAYEGDVAKPPGGRPGEGQAPGGGNVGISVAVLFLNPSGRGFTDTIDTVGVLPAAQLTIQIDLASGNYIVPFVPVGEVRIAVNTDAGQGDLMTARMQGGEYQGPDGKKKKRVSLDYVQVPKKFQSPESTTITTTLTAGQNAFNIEVPAK